MEYGPVKDSPIYLQRRLGGGSTPVFALSLSLTVSAVMMPFVIVGLVPVAGWRAIPIIATLYVVASAIGFVMALALTLIKGITQEERNEAIVLYPSFSLPRWQGKGERRFFAVLSILLFSGIIKQALSLTQSVGDGSIGMLLLMALIFGVIIVGLRPQRRDEHLSKGDDTATDV